MVCSPSNTLICQLVSPTLSWGDVKSQNVVDIENLSYLCSTAEEESVWDRSACYRGPAAVPLSGWLPHLKADAVARSPDPVSSPGAKGIVEGLAKA